MLTENNNPFWPWEEEVISEAEYQRSLEGLRRYVEEVEVNRLQTVAQKYILVD
jgi:hypothetical protein